MCYMFLFIGNTHKKLLPEFSQMLEQSLTEHQFIFYVRSLKCFFFFYWDVHPDDVPGHHILLWVYLRWGATPGGLNVICSFSLSLSPTQGNVYRESHIGITILKKIYKSFAMIISIVREWSTVFKHLSCGVLKQSSFCHILCYLGLWTNIFTSPAT